MAITSRIASVCDLIYAAGTAASPTTAAAHPARNMTRQPVRAAVIPGRPYVGQQQPGPSRRGDQWYEMNFEMELYGQRTTGVPWYGGRILEACGFAPAVSGGAYSYAQGDLHEDGDTPDGVTEPMSMSVNHDGLQFTASGLVGTGRLVMAAGQVPYIGFTMQGFLGVGAASGASETATTAYATYVESVAAKAASPSINGETSLAVPNFYYDFGNELLPRPDLAGSRGRSQPKLGRRTPGGQLMIEVTDLSTFNPFTLWAGGTSFACSFTHNPGGLTFDQIGVAFNAIITAQPDIVPVGDRLCWQLTFEQDPFSGPLTLTWSDN